MTPDVNVLVAAFRPDHPHHNPARAWLNDAVQQAAFKHTPLVLLGMVVLAWLAEGCRRRRYGAQQCSGLESGVLYWHMVDLVWVVLFPLVYVIG